MVQAEHTDTMSGEGRQHTPSPVAGDLGPSTHGGDDVAEEELLIEDVSIDGMCGVY